MDAISYSKAAQQEQRIKKVIAEPDSIAGLVSVPNLVPTGETITIPAGRTVVHPNLQVDGTLDVQGTLFVPAGGSVTQSLVDVTVVKQNGSVVANDSTVVHKTGDETKAGVLTLTDGLKLQGQNVSPFSGFKNYIINGKKVVNQRGLTSTDNSYNQDRWYKSGLNWFQGIEGDNNLISGKTYTLSWVGTATASYYVGTATSSTINAQSFTAITNGGNFTLTIASGKNLWIKFVSDSTGSTFNFVQLEEGSVATPFEQRPYGLELSLCQRYYESNMVSTLNLSTNTSYLGGMSNLYFKVSKMVVPSILITTNSGSKTAQIWAVNKDLIQFSPSSQATANDFINVIANANAEL